MSTSRLLCAAVLICSGLIGCHQAVPPEQQHAQTSPYAGHPDATSGATAGVPSTQPDFQQPTAEPQPAPGSAEALAQRATSYANSMQPMIDKHGAAARPAQPDWPDPDAMHLTAQVGADGTTMVGPAAGRGHTAQANASVSVQPTQSVVTAAAPRPEAAQASAGRAIIPTSPAPVVSDSLAARLTQRAKDYPADLSAQVDDQLLKLLDDQSVPDMQSLAGLSAEDRELLSAVMDSLTNFRNQLRSDNNMLFSKKIHPLVELADRLRSQAELSVPVVALCTSVKAFGVYDPIDPARFVAGKEQRVVVYCEVENFLSQINDHGLYETRLTQDMVLYTESSGLPVWSEKKSTYTDQARRRRHDFFVGKIITLPSNLTIGRYLLKVTIEDQQAKHIAENTVPIEIVAQ